MSSPDPQITCRLFLRVTFTLISPLCVGSGEGEMSDHDVARDFDEIPFVPATSICGILRRAMSRNDARRLFGYVDLPTQDNAFQSKMSSLRISDGRFIDAPQISIRDGVRLDKFRTACDMAKYDYEVIEPGARFVCDMECRIYDGERRDEFLAPLLGALASINAGNICLGHKANRGLGRLNVRCQMVAYSKERLAESLLFDGSDAVWAAGETLTLPKVARQHLTLEAYLTLNGTLCIRRYPALTSASTWDFEQLHSGDYSVIPGSSWTGALRGRCAQILEELGLRYETTERAMRWLFGYVPEAGARKSNQSPETEVSLPSRCVIAESQIEGGLGTVLTRAKVDRFTGAAAKGALYTKRVQCGGKTKLSLKINGGEELYWAMGLLLLALQDLDNGLLALGGEVSIGRGLFTVDRATLALEPTLAPMEYYRYLRRFIDRPDIPEAIPRPSDSSVQEVRNDDAQ